LPAESKSAFIGEIIYGANQAIAIGTVSREVGKLRWRRAAQRQQHDVANRQFNGAVGTHE